MSWSFVASWTSRFSVGSSFDRMVFFVLLARSLAMVRPRLVIWLVRFCCCWRSRKPLTSATAATSSVVIRKLDLTLSGRRIRLAVWPPLSGRSSAIRRPFQDRARGDPRAANEHPHDPTPAPEARRARHLARRSLDGQGWRAAGGLPAAYWDLLLASRSYCTSPRAPTNLARRL